MQCWLLHPGFCLRLQMQEESAHMCMCSSMCAKPSREKFNSIRCWRWWCKAGPCEMLSVAWERHNATDNNGNGRDNEFYVYKSRAQLVRRNSPLVVVFVDKQRHSAIRYCGDISEVMRLLNALGMDGMMIGFFLVYGDRNIDLDWMVSLLLNGSFVSGSESLRQYGANNKKTNGKLCTLKWNG